MGFIIQDLAMTKLASNKPVYINLSEIVDGLEVRYCVNPSYNVKNSTSFESTTEAKTCIDTLVEQGYGKDRFKVVGASIVKKQEETRDQIYKEKITQDTSKQLKEASKNKKLSKKERDCLKKLAGMLDDGSAEIC